MSLTITGAASQDGMTVLLNGGITADIISQLNKLCPDGDFVVNGDGTVTPADPSFCETAKGTCACLCQLINSANAWRIEGVKMDPGGTVGPNTLPDNNKGYAQANGQPTAGGCGGRIQTPTRNSGLEFGAYNPKGVMVYVAEEIVFGHELCGHAAFMDKGQHDPRPQPKGNRPGHDQAIGAENNIRREQGMTEMRGKFNDPNKGESAARPKKK